MLKIVRHYPRLIFTVGLLAGAIRVLSWNPSNPTGYIGLVVGAIAVLAYAFALLRVK